MFAKFKAKLPVTAWHHIFCQKLHQVNMITLKEQSQSLFSSKTTWINPGWLCKLFRFLASVVVILRSKDILENLNRDASEILAFLLRHCIFILRRFVKATMDIHIACFMRLQWKVLYRTGHSPSSILVPILRVFHSWGVKKRLLLNPSLGKGRNIISLLYCSITMNSQCVIWKCFSGQQPGQPCYPGCSHILCFRES